ncbi:MAG: hypothetical protein AMXMBFR13_15600 [Phycisphaerae bacterium]
MVDDEGRPVPDVQVRGSSPLFTDDLEWAFQLASRTSTDAQGRFTVLVPYADMRYSIAAEKTGWSNQWVKVLAGSTQPLEIKIKKGRHHRALGGQVVGKAGEPVAGIQVKLIAEYGFAREATTDERGRFTFEGIPDYFGQAVLVARAHGRVAPIPLLRTDSPEQVLRLGNPASVTGEVVAKDSGQPLADVTVTVRPYFANDFRVRAVSGKDGRFEITGVPPGAYLLEAESDAWFDRPPHGREAHRERRELSAGGQYVERFEMQPMAVVQGRVLDRADRPVSGALVAAKSTYLGDYRDQYRITRTDADGRFLLRTAHLQAGLSVSALSARHGLDHAVLPSPLNAGERVHVQLRLHGSVRVRGMVTDPAGQPIPNVICAGLSRGEVTDETNESGRFDLGLVPLPADDRTHPYVTCMPPRPPRGDEAYVSFVHAPIKREPHTPAGPTQYYQFQRVEYEPRADGEVDLQIRLEPAELLTFRGRVFDRSGEPVPKGRVHLFAGNADNWYMRIYPRIDFERIMMSRDVHLASRTADVEGRWQIHMVRESEEGMKLAHGWNVDATRFSIAAESADSTAVQFVKDLIPPKSESVVQLDLKLEQEPPTRPAE